MAIIGFYEYADIKIPSGITTVLVPTTIKARLSLETMTFSNLFPQTKIQQLITHYDLRNANPTAKSEWGLSSKEILLQAIPKISRPTATLGSSYPIDIAELKKRKLFLGFAANSLRDIMSQNINVYDPHTIELYFDISTDNDTDGINDSIFKFNSVSNELVIEVEFNKLSLQSVMNLRATIADDFNVNYDAIDFFEDIGLSGIEGQQILLEWVDSLIDFVK